MSMVLSGNTILLQATIIRDVWSSYIVSTVIFSSGVDQFRGHASCIWYSHVPLLTFQKAMFGRIVAEKFVIRGVNDHAPTEVAMPCVTLNGQLLHSGFNNLLL